MLITQPSCAKIGDGRLGFQRARSRGQATARRRHPSGGTLLGRARIRQITHRLADTVGMHKSGPLRYSRDARADLPAPHCRGLARMVGGAAREIERVGALRPRRLWRRPSTTPADRGMFCDLLAQAPLNLNETCPAVRDSLAPTTKSTPSSRSCGDSAQPHPTRLSTSSPPRPHYPARSGRWPTHLRSSGASRRDPRA